MTNAWSWRIPSLIQGVAPAIVVLAVFCGLPESPRWLYAQGRVAESRSILARYHAQGNLTADIVEQQGQIFLRETFGLWECEVDNYSLSLLAQARSSFVLPVQ